MADSRIREIARFASVGAINTVIDLGIFSIALYVFDLHIIVANTLAYSIAVLNSYMMNKFWTFAGRSSADISSAELFRFVAFNLGGLAISNFTVATLATLMAPIIAKLMSVGATFVWNYLTMKRFVFREDHATEQQET